MGRVRGRDVDSDGGGHRLARWRSLCRPSAAGSGAGRGNPYRARDASLFGGSSRRTRQDAAQMALVEGHYVIQTLPADRPDHALDIGVLPGRSWCCDDLGDSHRLGTAAEVRAVRRVAISKQIPGRRVPRKCFGHLAREPGCGGMPGDIESHNLPAIVGSTYSSRNDADATTNMSMAAMPWA